MVKRDISDNEQVECAALMSVFIELHDTLKDDGHNPVIIFAAIAGVFASIAASYNSGREEFIDYIAGVFDEAKTRRVTMTAKSN